MAFHLVCVTPFHQYVKGQVITDPAVVEKLSKDREHHFVRIAAPEPAPTTEGTESSPPEAPVKAEAPKETALPNIARLK